MSTTTLNHFFTSQFFGVISHQATSPKMELLETVMLKHDLFADNELFQLQFICTCQSTGYVKNKAFLLVKTY